MNSGPHTESDRRRPTRHRPPTTARAGAERATVYPDVSCTLFPPRPDRSSPPRPSTIRRTPPVVPHRRPDPKETELPLPTRPDNPTRPQTDSPEGDGGRRPRSVPRPRRGPKADETEDEQRTPPPNHTAAAPGHHRPPTAARAGAEGAAPSPPTTPRRVARPRCSAPIRRPMVTAPLPTATRHPDMTADRLLPRVRRADIPDRCPAPEGARRPTRRKMNSGPPHRIRPPPSQATADLSRQRAQEPKAPTPHGRSHPPRRGRPCPPHAPRRSEAPWSDPVDPPVPRAAATPLHDS